ncbi:MAG: PKD domain-containing protein, partial [Desulfuromonadales bacterium]|nr:PKD domain-containing protein [Desulfuromonadales bacterium]
SVVANTTTFNDLGALPGTTYYYRVRGITPQVYQNGSYVNSYTPYSNEASGTQNPASAPSGLTVTSGYTQKLVLNWTDNSADEQYFQVERKTGAGGTYAQIASVTANTVTYNDLGAQTGTTYFYRVRGVTPQVYQNGAYINGYTPYSNEASGTQTAVTAPSGLTITGGNSVGLALKWNDNTANETGFTIERKTGASGTYAQIASVAANVTSYVDMSVVSGTLYYYQVRASSTVGDFTSYSTAASGIQASVSPSGLTVSSANSIGLTLLWIDNTINESGFYIERRTGETGSFTQIAAVAANTTLYNDTTVLPGTIYYYRVRAYNNIDVNNIGYTPYSNEISASQAASAAPSGLTLAESPIGVTLSWTDNANDESGFYIERKIGAIGSYAKIGAVATNISTFIDQTIQYGTAYYYRVRSFTNEGGNSQYSNEVSLKSGMLKVMIVHAGNSTGSITLSPVADSSCGDGCSSYVIGTTVTATATPVTNSVFNGWSGACSGMGICTVTMDGDKIVTAAFDIPMPVVNFTATPTTGSSPVNVTFIDLSQGGISRLWDFGDGTTSTQQNPSHIYKSSGTFTVSLTVTNVSGSNTSTQNITVNACTANTQIKIGIIYYGTLQAAYNAAADGTTIQVQALDFTESLIATAAKSVTVDGGYMCGFTDNPGITTIHGEPHISFGSVKLKNIQVSN